MARPPKDPTGRGNAIKWLANLAQWIRGMYTRIRVSAPLAIDSDINGCTITLKDIPGGGGLFEAILEEDLNWGGIAYAAIYRITPNKDSSGTVTSVNSVRVGGDSATFPVHETRKIRPNTKVIDGAQITVALWDGQRSFYGLVNAECADIEDI